MPYTGVIYFLPTSFMDDTILTSVDGEGADSETPAPDAETPETPETPEAPVDE